MNKLLPIVEGCDAIIVNSMAGNYGGVKVGKCLGNYRGNGSIVWETDRPIKKVSLITGKYIGSECVIYEKNLMRIDGNESQFKEEQKVLELVK